MLQGTPYVRHKGYVRIHIFIRMLQVNLAPLHTIYTRTYIAHDTRWYQRVFPVIHQHQKNAYTTPPTNNIYSLLSVMRWVRRGGERGNINVSICTKRAGIAADKWQSRLLAAIYIQIYQCDAPTETWRAEVR